jgi:hypothetical protein
MAKITLTPTNEELDPGGPTSNSIPWSSIQLVPDSSSIPISFANKVTRVQEEGDVQNYGRSGGGFHAHKLREGFDMLGASEF